MADSSRIEEIPAYLSGEREVIAELRQILNARSVAIVGASNRPGKFGCTFTQEFINVGFERLYPINPHDKEVLGLRAYPSIIDVPDEVDLAYVLTPTSAVLGAVEQCGAKGVKGIIVYTSGFAEASAEGAAVQKELVKAARSHGARLIGPNCLGIYSPSRKLPFMVPGMPNESGSIAMISHSGSLGEYVTKAAHTKGLHFDTVVSLGNEADLNAVDFLAYFGADPTISVIVAYLEGINDGQRFVRLAREIGRRKPIIVLKGGMTEGGSQAAGSHTGALAGSGAVWEAVFEQTGIIAPESVDDLLDILFAAVRLPRPRGPRIAIVSGPGGPAVLAADTCVREGLKLATLSAQTKKQLGRMLPSVGTSFRNPVDAGMSVLKDPTLYRRIIELLAQDANVDGILAIGISDMRCAQALIEANASLIKPLVVSGLVPPQAIPDWYLTQTAHGVAVYADARFAIATYAKLYRWSSGATEK